MNLLTNLLTGGFLKGYRTYVLGAALVVQALAMWAVGDMSAAELLTKLPEILGGLGLMALRAAK